MRGDMPRVLVERPRGGRRITFGHRCSAFERKTRSRDGEEALPERMPMGFARSKWLSENLAPLRRFLMARRGRPWDDVYSELRQGLAPRSAIDMHILQHLWGYVRFASRDHAGRLLLRDRAGHQPIELLPSGGLATPYWQRHLFYVCCDTGLLRWVRPEKRKRRRVSPPTEERT